jgi:hypothetical protein
MSYHGYIVYQCFSSLSPAHRFPTAVLLVPAGSATGALHVAIHAHHRAVYYQSFSNLHHAHRTRLPAAGWEPPPAPARPAPRACPEHHQPRAPEVKAKATFGSSVGLVVYVCSCPCPSSCTGTRPGLDWFAVSRVHPPTAASTARGGGRGAGKEGEPLLLVSPPFYKRTPREAWTGHQLYSEPKPLLLQPSLHQIPLQPEDHPPSSPHRAQRSAARSLPPSILSCPPMHQTTISFSFLGSSPRDSHDILSCPLKKSA